MTSLNDMDKAVQLYEAIGKHVPLFQDIPNDYLDFVGRIVTSIKETQDYDSYFKSIQIMSGATYNTLSSSDPSEVLQLFFNGLMEWKIVELVQFFREVGYLND